MDESGGGKTKPIAYAPPEPSETPSRKTRALLAYLAYHRRTHSRDALMELFWPEAEPAPARHNLSQALSSLKRLGSITRLIRA